jgi:hypothetical protein
MPMLPSDTAPGDATPSLDVLPLDKLPDAQVFSRDPEDYTQENTADTIARLTKLVARYRKARQDGEELTTLAAKLKKTNAAAKRKKAKLAADPMETTI